MKKKIYQTPYLEVFKAMTETLLNTPSQTEQDGEADAKEQPDFVEEETAPVSPNLWGDTEEEE